MFVCTNAPNDTDLVRIRHRSHACASCNLAVKKCNVCFVGHRSHACVSCNWSVLEMANAGEKDWGRVDGIGKKLSWLVVKEMRGK